MILLEGALSVKAAVESGARTIQSIWMDEAKESKDFDYIKRIVGIPGDKLMMRDKVLYRNGQALQEPYVRHTPTSDRSRRLLVTRWVSSRRANSRCLGAGPSRGNCSRNHSYRGRWLSNSRLHSEWVVPSMASDWPWAQS